MLIVMAIVGAHAADADAAEAQLRVSVRVPAVVQLEAVDVPARLLLSETDVKRGYKDLSARYVVSQNTDRGWLLRLSPRLGLTRYIEIRGLAQTIVLQTDSLEVFNPRAKGPQTLALDYRFILEPDARPGSYELPVHLSATPL